MTAEDRAKRAIERWMERGRRKRQCECTMCQGHLAEDLVEAVAEEIRIAMRDAQDVAARPRWRG